MRENPWASFSRLITNEIMQEAKRARTEEEGAEQGREQKLLLMEALLGTKARVAYERGVLARALGSQAMADMHIAARGRRGAKRRCPKVDAADEADLMAYVRHTGPFTAEEAARFRAFFKKCRPYHKLLAHVEFDQLVEDLTIL